MSKQRVPWLLWVREGVDDALLDAGRRAGLTDAGGPPAMALAPIGPAPEPPSELEIEVIDSPAGIDIYRDLAARGFEMPIDFATKLVSEATLADPGIGAVLGTVAGEPVSVACWFA